MTALEAHTSEAENAIKNLPKEVEENIKGISMTVDSASQNGKDRINRIIDAALEKIAPDDTAMQKPEVQPYLTRLEEARKKAVQEIDDNKDRYNKIYDFVVKKADTEVMLEMNNVTFLGIVGSVDIEIASMLLKVSKGLQDTVSSLQGLDAPGMEKGETELLQKIKKQADIFEKRAGDIKDYISGRIDEQDDAMDHVNQALKEGKKPNADHVTLVETHYSFLAGVAFFMEQNMPDDPLLTVVTQKINAIEPVMAAIDTHAAKSDYFVKASVREQKMGENLYSAQMNLNKVLADPHATATEKAAARGWLAGAKQEYAKAYQQMLEARYKTFLGGENGRPKVRTGTTVVEPAAPEIPVATKKVGNDRGKV